MNAITEDANITEEAIKYIACPTCKQPAGELCVALVSRKPVLLVQRRPRRSAEASLVGRLRRRL